MEDGVSLPCCFVGAVVAEVFFDAPVVGEGRKVHTAAGGAGCTEQIFVMHGQIEGAMAAHAKAGDGAVSAVGYRRIMAIDIGNKLFADEGLVADFGVFGAVEIPAVVAAVRTDEEDAQGVGFLRQLRRRGGPLGIVAAMAME